MVTTQRPWVNNWGLVKVEKVPCPVVTLNYQKDGGQDDYDRKRIVICVHGIVWGDSREYQSDGNW